MTIGQLWYGWTARGAEGLNMAQIIAASGVLDNPDHPLTRFALEPCYEATQPAFGWRERDGVRLAFRRSPAGVDGRGRPGSVFVHVLVGATDTLSCAVLAQLWAASVWHCAVPAVQPRRLAPITHIGELGLSPPPELGHEMLSRAIAGYLVNVASDRRSALAFDESQTVVIASRIGAAIPARFGAPSFSTHEREERAHQYDLVRDARPSGLFAVVGTHDDPGAAWMSAGRLLVDAHEDPTLRDVVHAIAERSSSVREFASGLLQWTSLMRGDTVSPDATRTPTARAISLATADDRFAAALLSGSGREQVAKAFAAGASGAAAVLTRAGPAGTDTALAAELARQLQQLDPHLAVQRLATLRVEAPQIAAETSVQTTDLWAATDRIRFVDPQDAALLLEMSGELAATPGPGCDALLMQPSLTRMIVQSARVPSTWQARAAAVHPERLRPHELIRVFGHSAECARHLDGNPRLQNLIGDALADVPLSEASAVVPVISDAVSTAISDEWRLSCLRRICDPVQRYQKTVALLAARDQTSEVWADFALDAYTASVLERRHLPEPLLRLHSVITRCRTSRRAAQWDLLLRRLAETDEMSLDTATSVDASARLLPEFDRTDHEAAVELAVHAMAKGATEDYAAWTAACRTMRAVAHLSFAALVHAMARAATRSDVGNPVACACCVITWVAERVDKRVIDAEMLKHEALLGLGSPMRTAGGREDLAELEQDYKRNREIHRWIRHLQG